MSKMLLPTVPQIIGYLYKGMLIEQTGYNCSIIPYLL